MGEQFVRQALQAWAAAQARRVLRSCSVLLLGCLPALTLAEPVLRVGVYHNPPKIVLDEGRASGIFGDLLTHVAQAEGWQLESVPCAWEVCLAKLVSGRIDLLPDVAWQPERGEQLRFHQEPVLHSWSQVYQSPGDAVQGFLDLDGRRVAVLEGSVQQAYLQEMASGFDISTQLVPRSDFEAAFAAVRDGQADVVVTNRHFGDRHAAEFGLTPGGLMFQPVRLFFAGRPGLDDALLARIDAHLQEWQGRAGSPYQQVLDDWGALDRQRDTHAGWVLAVLAALAGLALIATALALRLRRQVSHRTRDLHRVERRLATILDSVDAAIFIKNEALQYQYVNQKVADLLGRPITDILGKKDSDLFDSHTAERLRQNDLLIIEGGERLVTEEVNTADSSGAQQTWLSVKIPLKPDANAPTALCGIATDITDYRRIQGEVHQLAYFDQLTRLPNRKLLLERLARAVHDQSGTDMEGGLLLVDLNGFRLVNETRGFAAGDLLLQQTAARIQRLLGESDTLARIGSDHFVVLLEELASSREDANRRLEAMARQVLDALARPHDLGGVHDWVVTASVGITLLSGADEGSSESLLAQAELALKQARQSGSGGLAFYVPALQEESARRARLEAELRNALGQDALQVYLQPQFDLAGRCTGMEVLLRWMHPERGLVAPGEFVPVAESIDLITELGDWVLRRAAAVLADWSRDPELALLSLSVNISAGQFREPRFVERVLGILKEAGVAGSRLTLELTESLLLEDVDIAGDTMARLQAEGVRFALDDFGTGYASLQYLKRLPLAELKIDQTFVRDLLVDPNDAAIVATIVALGRSLGLQVVAEGVETPEQLARLQELGCERFQGFLLARPMPVSSWQQRPRASALAQS